MTTMPNSMMGLAEANPTTAFGYRTSRDAEGRHAEPVPRIPTGGMMGKRSVKDDRKQVVVVSDIHCGCRLGLCPKDGVTLDDGGTYIPSRIQKKVWGMWEEFWGDWVPHVTKGEPYDVVFNGDAIDGVHHGSVTQVSHNITDQVSIAVECLRPVAEKAERFYMVRGTEAHVGKSAQAEEGLARALGAVPNEDGQHNRWELWLRVGGHLVQQRYPDHLP